MRTVAVGVAAFASVLGIAWRALAASESVVFPAGYEDGVHYATVKRGNITEELFTSRTAIDAVKKRSQRSRKGAEMPC